MSEIEDAASTVARLLKHNLRVIKDNGTIANLNVTSEWQDLDALKGYDGQVTVGLADSTDQKLELSGKNRKRTSTIRVNVWATEIPNAESAKTMSGKIVEEVNRSIRQNRNKPNETLHHLVGYGSGEQAYKAYQSSSELAPDNSAWTELSSVEYQQLWYSDDVRYQISYDESGEYATALFGFKLESRKNTVKKMVLTFEGYGTAPDGDGVTVKVWSKPLSAWVNAQTGGAGGIDEAFTIVLLNELSDYVDDEGYVWLLAKTINPSNGAVPATLFCDYTSCTVTVNGITYCDVAGYRQLDCVDVKPFIFRTEFTVKSWFFENTGV